MSATIQDADGNPLRTTGKREPKLFKIAYTLGSSGDPATGTLLERSDVTMTLTRTGTGLFTVVLPLWPVGATVFLEFWSVQATPAVGNMVCLTETQSTGTITLRFFGNVIATPVDFASGDTLRVWAWVDSTTVGSPA